MKKGILLTLIAGTLWGIMGLFVRTLGSTGLDSMQIVAMRIIFTAVILAAGAALFKPSLFKIRFRDLWCFLGTGIISIVLFTYCYFRTMTLTSLATAAVLLYTAPVMVMLMSILFFREKITPRKLISCALALVGCVLVTGVLGESGAISPAGLALGLVSAFGYALYSIFGRVALNRGYHPLTLTLYTFLFATLGVLPLTNLRGIAEVAAESPTVIPFGILMAVISAVIPYTTYTTALTYIESSRASIIASVEPVVATLTGILIFHEPLTLDSLAGIILVLASLVLLNLEPKKSKKEKES